MPKEVKYFCNKCSATRTLGASGIPGQTDSFPTSVICGWRGCKGACYPEGKEPVEAPEPTSPVEQVLIDAKLAGTSNEQAVPMTYGYLFRTNEQAAKLALNALKEAGYKVVPIKRLTVTNYKTCPACGGSGYKRKKSANETGEGCRSCGGGPTRKGRGEVIDDEPLALRGLNADLAILDEPFQET